MKKALFMLAMLLFTLGVVEVMARLTHHLLFDEGTAGRTEVDTLPPEQALRSRRSIFDTRQMHNSDVLHPFYGVVRGWRGESLNIMPPPRRREGTWTLALFGASVAKDVAGELRNALFQRFLEIGGDVTPVFVDFSAGGFHQPQQAGALANVLANGGQFDAIVVLDGYNEATGPSAQAYFGFYSLYPAHWPSLVEMAVEQRVIVRRISALREEERRLGRSGQADVLQRSAVFRVIRRFRLDRIERRILQAHHELLAAGMVGYGLEKHGPRQGATEDDLRTMGARSWHQGALLMAGLARRHGAEYYHFLQPNQYVPDSKPLSADELAMTDLAGDTSPEVVPRGYAQIREYGLLLREQGIRFFDLSWIYQDHPETLYIDSCCHLNKRGNELLAAAMLRRIFDKAPSVEGRRALAPVARSAFDIYHLGNALGYAKTPCNPADTQAPLFLHVTPMHEDDLPPSRSRSAFDNLDFSFANLGTVFGARCVATVPLPHYAVDKVNTGQDGAAPWRVEFTPGDAR